MTTAPAPDSPPDSPNPPDRPRLVYRLCHADDWSAAQAQGELAPNAADTRDGFIHLSASHQVAGTAARHYATVRPLVLLTIDGHRLPRGQLVWEPSRDGQDFPHLYGPLPIQAVAAAAALTDDASGHPALPPLPDHPETQTQTQTPGDPRP